VYKHATANYLVVFSTLALATATYANDAAAVTAGLDIKTGAIGTDFTFKSTCKGTDNKISIGVFLDAAHAYPITVHYQIRSSAATASSAATGTHPATAGTDFIAMVGTVTFAAEVYEGSLNLTLIADGIYEDVDEEVDIVLTNVTAACPSPSPSQTYYGTQCVTIDPTADTAYVRIADPGDAGVLMFDEVKYDWGWGREVLEGNADGTPSIATVTVKRVGGSDGKISVEYKDSTFASTAPNSAISGADFTKITTGTLVFEEHEVTKSFTVKIIQVWWCGCCS
jgi:hypothetical protein